MQKRQRPLNWVLVGLTSVSLLRCSTDSHQAINAGAAADGSGGASVGGRASNAGTGGKIFPGDGGAEPGEAGTAGEAGIIGSAAAAGASGAAAGATAAGGGSGGASAGSGGSGGLAGPSCLGNTALALTALAPYWLDQSTACGTATVGAQGLTLTRTAGCSSDQSGGWVKLDETKWRLCGDFDVRVDFTLTTFAVPPGGTRWAAIRAFDPASSSGIALERYNENLSGCFPASNNYKGWTTSAADCAGAIFRATTDMTGTFRMTRSGSTVSSYTWLGADAGADGWSVFDTDTGMTTTPWSLELYTGVYNGDSTAQEVTFSNLIITSASTP